MIVKISWCECKWFVIFSPSVSKWFHIGPNPPCNYILSWVYRWFDWRVVVEHFKQDGFGVVNREQKKHGCSSNKADDVVVVTVERLQSRRLCMFLYTPDVVEEAILDVKVREHPSSSIFSRCFGVEEGGLKERLRFTMLSLSLENSLV